MKIFKQDVNIPIPFISDTHFGSKTFNKTVFQQMMLFFEEQFFPWCLKNGVKNVIHCGDLVHNRSIIDLWINQEIKNRFFEWFEKNEINLHCIVGNHDAYYKTTIDYNYLIKNTEEYEFIHVYQQQEKIKIGKYTFLMVPWIPNIDNFSFIDDADINVGHYDMIGFRMNHFKNSDEGLEPKTFENFKLVFSGHYHVRSHKKNIYYVGTQYPITWNDYGEDKGFYILENDFNVKYIENKINGKFLKIYYNEVDGKEIIKVGGIKKRNLIDISTEEAIDLAKKNYCKIITKNITNQSKFDAFYTSLTIVSRDNYKIEIIDGNEIVENFDLSELEQEIENETDILVTVENYINNMKFEKEIDNKFLISLFNKYYKECSDKVVN